MFQGSRTTGSAAPNSPGLLPAGPSCSQLGLLGPGRRPGSSAAGGGVGSGEACTAQVGCPCRRDVLPGPGRNREAGRGGCGLLTLGCHGGAFPGGAGRRTARQGRGRRLPLWSRMVPRATRGWSPGTTAAQPARRKPCSRSEGKPSGEEPVPAARESPHRATKNKRRVNVSKR